MYSAQKLDHSNNLVAAGNTGWLVSTVLPKIDDLVEDEGIESAVEHLKNRLLEDYNHETRPEKIESRPCSVDVCMKATAMFVMTKPSQY